MKILFFSPNSAIWRHLSAEIQISLELVAENHEITFLNCDRNFSEFCVSMSAFGLTYDSSFQEKEKVCQRCVRTTEYIDKIQFFENVSMPNLQVFDQQILEVISGVNSANWHQLEFAGIPIGRMAAYEFLLNNKIASLIIPESLFPAYLSSLKYSMAVLFFAQEFLRTHSFESVIVYNRIYSLNNVFCRVAESMGIPTYTLHAAGLIDNHYSRFSLYRKDIQALTVNSSTAWDEFKQFSIGKQESKSVVNHFRGLLKASSPWVYSSRYRGLSPSSLRQRLRIPNESKVLLLTTSSADEIFAIKLIGVNPLNSRHPEVFASQLDWIKSVCEYVLTQRNLFLIIRIHPREFPNKRESLESLNGGRILEIVENFSAPNIYLNLPGDDIALYDLAGVTNLLLTGNSSAGAELAALEIPVLCHERRNLTAFPEDLAFWAATKEEYFKLVPELLLLGKSSEQAVLAIRWFSFKYSRVGRPTRISKNGFLLSLEALLRKPTLKYGYKVPKFVTRFIYWMQFKRLEIPGKSDFGFVIERNLGGLHELKMTANTEDGLESEMNTIVSIKKLFNQLR